jgi:AraC-like DNA-binding protein
MIRAIEPRGVLSPHAAEEQFDLTLQPPQADLTEVVEHYWCVRWDLRGRGPHQQHTLPHPSVHLVVEPDRASIVGVVTHGRFTRVLDGLGWAFGIKFRPAGFRPFFGSRVSSLTGQSVPVSDVFGRDGSAYVAQLRSLLGVAEMAEAAAAFLRRQTAPVDETVVLINAIVAAIVADRAITRVADVVERYALSERRLQRLFSEYVGIGPKWVIQRCRLIEAAERLAEGAELDSAALAQELGYFDQAHFIRDFRAIVGRPPADYARSVRQGRS